ncbi:MAG: metallopeptidase TldD-related protein [Thermodesulfobacteriota bacterium]
MRMGGGQVNTVNKVTLTGNGQEILKKIDIVGSDLGFGIGTCGKDAQDVPVANAEPTLRIPEIVVGEYVG